MYGVGEGDEVKTEESTPAPQTAYAKCKVMVERDLQAMADAAPAHSVVALVELAKYWEHRRRDATRAHELASRARDRWLAHLPARERPLPGLPTWRDTRTHPAPDDFARRLARLERKQRLAQRSEGAAGGADGGQDADGEADTVLRHPPLFRKTSVPASFPPSADLGA